MEWFSQTKSEFFPNDSVSDFWCKVADLIPPYNPTFHYGLINEHLEQWTFLNGDLVSIDDLYVSSKLMKCKGLSKMLSSRTRPYHICRWFVHILSLYPDPSFEYYQRRTERFDNRLISALEKGDQRLFEILLDLVDVHARSTNKGGACPLHIAAEKGNLKAIELLLAKGADLEIKDKEGLTPVFYAVKSRSLAVMKFLKDLGANLFHVEDQGRSLFYWAASLGTLNMLDFLLQEGLDPNTHTKLGRTALSKSAWNGSIEVCRYLLKLENIQVEVKDKNGRTALHNAVWGSAGGREGKKMGLNETDSPECARLLLEKGCDIEAEDNGGNTPICIACSTYSPKSLEILIEFGADMYHCNSKGKNAFHQALGRGNLDLAEYLLARGMPLSIPTARFTCTQICIKYGMTQSLEWIISHGVKPEDSDYVLAMKLGFISIIEVLLKVFGPVEGFLRLAMEHGNKEVCLYAVEKVEINEEGVLLALGKDKEIGLAALGRWTGKITNNMISKMIEAKIDTDKFLERAEVNGNVLRLAIKQKNLKVALKILENNPELVEESDVYSGNTALHIACISGFIEIIPKLIELCKDPINYILRQNKKELTPILLSQVHKHRLSIAEFLKDLISQSEKNSSFSQIKALNYELINTPLTPHPYKDQMPNAYIPSKLSISKTEEVPLTWIDTVQGLEETYEKLKGFPVLGIDLEYHLYEAKKGLICLIQISNGLEDFVIDALVNRQTLASFLSKIIDSPDIVKVFHGADSDLLWLQNDFDLHPVRVFDTARAFKIINKEPYLPSLELLLFKYFNFKADKSFQISEWRIRPLPSAMLEYARTDSRFLIELYNQMLSEMSSQDIAELASLCNSLCLKSPEGRFMRLVIKD